MQRQMREIGRIRLGYQAEYEDRGKTKRRPAKLETFRLTSVSHEIIAAAAQVYGGQARAWQNGDRDEFEVVTEATVLDILLPPGERVSQFYELWTGGGCVRRCDGITESLSGQPCLCPKVIAERVRLAQRGEACKATTRLSVMLPALPDLGVFRLESHGYYAAVELAGAADVLAIATENGVMLPARLRLDQRSKKVPGQPTNYYVVPVIEFVDMRMADLQQLMAGESGAADRLARPAVPALPATTLPATSDFRAPAPLERPVSEADGEMASVDADNGAAVPRPVARDGRALCALAHPEGRGTCGMLFGHLDDPRAPRVHKVIGPKGDVLESWPADER